MAGLPWVRLDTAFPYNPKVLALIGEPQGHRAVAVYLFGLSYSGGHGLDGYLPAHVLPVLHGRKADAAKLVAHGFWLEQPGGWQINGWTEFQPSGEEYENRRKKAQAAAQARWSRERGEAS